jgi:hypothetical protein
MNERIKQLAIQAGGGPSKWYTDTDVLEEFAELIVLEMCNVLDRAQWDKGQDWVCADGTRIIPQIKQHFGVEE